MILLLFVSDLAVNPASSRFIFISGCLFFICGWLVLCNDVTGVGLFAREGLVQGLCDSGRFDMVKRVPRD